MRQIIKGAEPRSLTEHRAKTHASYDNYAEKDDLRASLVREQGGLCCYCMRRIAAEDMKIEHWAAQDTHPEQQLDYANLLGCCLGGEGKPRAEQTCDTHKGSQAMSIHPADLRRNCEHLIEYHSDGEIDAKLPEVQRDLRDVLNLNVPWLCNNRRNVVDGMVEGMRRKHAGPWSQGVLEREIETWRGRTARGVYREYCQVVIFWLEKRLARERK